MVGLSLMRSIERHSERLTRGLTEQICRSERTSDFRKILPKDSQLAVTEVYRNLGEWVLQKTEVDIERWFSRDFSRGYSMSKCGGKINSKRPRFLWHNCVVQA